MTIHAAAAVLNLDAHDRAVHTMDRISRANSALAWAMHGDVTRTDATLAKLDADSLTEVIVAAGILAGRAAALMAPPEPLPPAEGPAPILFAGTADEAARILGGAS